MKNYLSYICIISILFLLNCNSTNNYPEEIIGNRLQNLYDSAKWLIYSSNYHGKGITCNINKPNYKNNTYLDTINIVSIDLKLQYLIINGDTVEMRFQFINKDSCENCYPASGPKQQTYINTIISIKGIDILFRSIGNFKMTELDLKNQYLFEKDKSLSIDSLNNCYGYFKQSTEQVMFPKFLKKYNGKINKWLKEEALKRGVL